MADFHRLHVENASYGLTICAERTPSLLLFGHFEKAVIVAVAVINHRGVPCSPCGACRQVLAEFGPRATVWYLGLKVW